MSDVNKLSVLLETVKARLAQEKHAGDWPSVASSEAELAHVAGQLSQAQAAEARKAQEAADKKRKDDAAWAWDVAQRDAESLRASWASWISEMTAIDERLNVLADARRQMDAKAAELYQRGDALRQQPIIVSFEMPARLSEVQTYRLPTIRG